MTFNRIPTGASLSITKNSSNLNSLISSNNSNISNTGSIKELTLYDAINNSNTEIVKDLLANNSFNQNTKDIYLIRTLKKYKQSKKLGFLKSIELLLK